LKQLVVIAGPTASGKTRTAIELAKIFDTEIFNCDSRQFFRGMDIGTAKPTKREQFEIPHHFIDYKDPSDSYSCGAFEKDCIQALNEFFKTHDVAILVGGSGLYIKAIVEGLDELPSDKEIRSRLKQELENRGIEWLKKQLAQADPKFTESLNFVNPQRLIRAMEVIEITGMPYTQQLTNELASRSFKSICFALQCDRDRLYQQINQRVDQMIEQGLVQEVKRLVAWRDSNALQTVGYREIFEYLDDQRTLEESIELIKQHTRNYAKRQITWFKNQGNFIPIEETYAQNVLKHLSKDMNV
jgi:tRNA dimethylallyltransferase